MADDDGRALGAQDDEGRVRNDDEPAEGSWAARLELISAIILGLAATLTAVSAFYSAKVGGDEVAGLTGSTNAVSDANFFYQQGNSQLAQDTQLFIAYVDALQAEDAARAQVAQGLMDENLLTALDEWEAAGQEGSPFDGSTSYVVLNQDLADEEQANYDRLLVEAGDAGAQGDLFDLSNVVFAVALFTGGILNLFRRRVMQYALIGASTVLIVGGTVVMVLGFGATA